MATIFVLTDFWLVLKCHSVATDCCTCVCFWGAEGAPILFSDLGLRMASCSYIYIYIYIYFCHFANGGAHVVLYKALNPL